MPMKVLGFSASEFIKIGLAASIFILMAKWLAPKTGVHALTTTTERI
jgi:hypothetical protein